MTKHLVDIDDQLLERARAVAGTSTIKATVDAALRKLANDELLFEHLRWLRKPGSLDIEAMEKARAPDFPLDE